MERLKIHELRRLETLVFSDEKLRANAELKKIVRVFASTQNPKALAKQTFKFRICDYFSHEEQEKYNVLLIDKGEVYQIVEDRMEAIIDEAVKILNSQTETLIFEIVEREIDFKKYSLVGNAFGKFNTFTCWISCKEK